MKTFIINFSVWFTTIFIFYWLVNFFIADEGRFQKWRLRKALDNIVSYIDANTEGSHPPIVVSFMFKKRNFEVGVLENKVNRHYRCHQLFINGEEVACYHCLEHLFTYSCYLENTSSRSMEEVISIVHAANKYTKKLEKETTEKKIPDWKANSYFK